jgi:uncharacterized protein involved in exopolysaccharide biosynthesis
MALQNNQIENLNIDNDEISLKEGLDKIKQGISFLVSKWKIIIIFSIIGCIVGFKIADNEKPIYKAVLTFAMEEDKGSGGGFSGALGLASTFGIDIGSGGGGGAFSGNNLIDLMKSRKLVEKTLLNPIEIDNQIVSLAEYYIQINKMRESWGNKSNYTGIKFLPNADRSKFSLEQNSCLYEIYSNLTSPKSLTIQLKDKKVSITGIEVNNQNENFSKIFCEQLAKEISEYYMEIKSKKAKMNLEILQKQTDSIRSELNDAISGVANAADNVYNLNPSLNIRRTPSTKRQVDVQALTTMLTQLIAQLELAKVNVRRETPLIQVIDTPILPLQKVNFGKPKTMAIGIFLGVILSFCYILALHFYKQI